MSHSDEQFNAVMDARRLVIDALEIEGRTVVGYLGYGVVGTVIDGVQIEFEIRCPRKPVWEVRGGN
jgi:hypothetical protein